MPGRAKGSRWGVMRKGTVQPWTAEVESCRKMTLVLCKETRIVGKEIRVRKKETRVVQKEYSCRERKTK
jgi:hypothetical protein